MSHRSALRDRTVAHLATAQCLSVIGDGCNAVAIAFAVLDLTDSAGALSTVLAARVAGLAASLLFGGVLADRMDRGRLLVRSDLVRFAAQGLLAVGLFAGPIGLGPIAVLQLVHGLASGCFLPTYGGFVPQLVPADRLQRTNAAITAVTGTANLAGPALAGALTAAWGPAWALALDSVTFLGSAALISRCRRAAAPSAPAAASGPSVLHELRTGAREVATRSWLAAGICYFVVNQLCLAGPVYVLGPIAAATGLGGATGWGVLLTAFAVGGVLGSLAAGRFTPTRPMAAVLVCSVPIAVLPAALGLGAELPALVAAEVLAGAAVMFTDIVWQSTIQRHVPGATLSRALSWDLFGYTVSRPVSMALVGLAAQLAGARTVFLSSAVALVGAAALTGTVRGVRHLPDRPREQIAEPERSPL
ncbi:MFS transporter [Kitasatospora xanthocidica]|uniref:MFS transporter n=1 Tax=Kitasatospora xanthocidica TaxID=83382 RepID=A0A372ZNN0_9ACTN|nr:MFS transporter [Kitasatospora xanthocidica]RGD57499.1 MFS transporter [Kitasatospora xanthocidica]